MLAAMDLSKGFDTVDYAHLILDIMGTTLPNDWINEIPIDPVYFHDMDITHNPI